MITEEQVITVPITYEMKQEALEQERLINKQKKNSKTTLNLNHRMHFYGALGEICVRQWFLDQGLLNPFIKYFDENAYGDSCDFEHRGEKIDVKTAMGDSSIEGRSFVNYRQKKKIVDKYCFVKIDKERQEANIMGVIDYDEFYRHSKYFEKLKSPAYGVPTEFLDPFRNFAYGV